MVWGVSRFLQAVSAKGNRCRCALRNCLRGVGETRTDAKGEHCDGGKSWELSLKNLTGKGRGSENAKGVNRNASVLSRKQNRKGYRDKKELRENRGCGTLISTEETVEETSERISHVKQRNEKQGGRITEGKETKDYFDAIRGNKKGPGGGFAVQEGPVKGKSKNPVEVTPDHPEKGDENPKGRVSLRNSQGTRRDESKLEPSLLGEG